MSLLAQYSAPWKGINTSVPDNHIDRAEAASSTNFTFYEGRLQQPFYYKANLDDTTPDGNPIEAVFRFTDPSGVTRQGVITKAHLYEISGTHYLAGLALPATGKYQTNIQVLQNRLFFVNGSKYVLYWDGGASVSQATNAYGARYIFELAGSLCIAWTIESSEFNQRVRWAVSGTYTDWTGLGSGFEDLLECPDGITGVFNTSPVAYILRDNGITQMIPTGIGTAAFAFNHLWASLKGVGNILHNVADNFGPVGFAFSFDDIYTVTSSSYQRIATKVKNQLYKNIDEISQGWVEPQIAQFAPFLRYRLTIPDLVNGDDIWNFNTEDYSWEREKLTGYNITGRPYFNDGTDEDPADWIFVLPVKKIGTPAKYQLLVYGAPGGSPAIEGLNPVVFQGTYKFKTEYDDQGRSITVRQVKVRYLYQGNPAGKGIATTVSVQGMYGNTVSKTIQLADPSLTKADLGGALPPKTSGKFYSAYFAVPLTDQEEFQVTLTVGVPPNNFPTVVYPSIEISDVCVYGDVGKEVAR